MQIDHASGRTLMSPKVDALYLFLVSRTGFNSQLRWSVILNITAGPRTVLSGLSGLPLLSVSFKRHFRLLENTSHAQRARVVKIQGLLIQPIVFLFYVNHIESSQTNHHKQAKLVWSRSLNGPFLL